MKQKSAPLIGIFALIILLAIGGTVTYFASVYFGSGNWMVRYQTEMTEFFGEDRWEHIDTQRNQSNFFSTYSSDTSQEHKGIYKNWDIEFTDKNGEEWSRTITNHTLKINHQKKFFLSDSYLSNDEAFVQQLLWIAYDLASYHEVNRLFGTLSDARKDTLRFEVNSFGGYPPAKFYKELWKEDWFQADKLTVSDFLATDLYQFELYVALYDYELEDLSKEESDQLLALLSDMDSILLEEYGEDASFTVAFGDGNHIEYVDGKLEVDEW